MDVLPLDLTGDGALRAAVAADREVTRMEGVRLDHLAQYLAEAAADWMPPAWTTPGSEQPIRLGGPGTPEIPEFTVCEVAAALGLSQPAATSLCADVLDLAYRLRSIAQSVRAGTLPFARARVIARRTRDLTAEQVAAVEERLCRLRHTGQGPVPMIALVAMSRLRTVVDQAILTVRGPESIEEAAERVAGSLFVDLVHESTGATDLAARLATPDAGRLDRRLDEIAGWLTGAGDDRPKPVLRAVALGLLADPGLLAALDEHNQAAQGPGPRSCADSADLGEGRDAPATPATTGTGGADHDLTTGLRATGLGIAGCPAGLLEKFASLTSTVLYLHLDRDSDTWCEEKTGALAKQVAQQIVGHSNVTVRPVLDLAADLTYTGYVAPPNLKEQLALRNGGYCTFPHCHRRARAGDVDHQDSAARGGPTASRNTHRLCRKHHRAKDKGRWRVVQPAPGIWLWTSPAGAVYLVTNGTTTPLNGIFARTAPPAPAPEAARATDLAVEAPPGAAATPGGSDAPAAGGAADLEAASRRQLPNTRLDGSDWSPTWDPWDDWDPLTADEHEYTYGLINAC